MTSTEPVRLEEIKNMINIQLDVILNFAEFIAGEKPSSKYTRTIAELRLFQQKFSEASSPSTTYAKTIEHQNKILTLLINWNPAISSQLLNLVKFYSDVNKLMAGPVTLRETNPFGLIMENQDKFSRGHQLMDEVFEKFFMGMFDSVDCYSLFYCLIASVESIEYPIYKEFIKMLKQYRLESKYDPNEIFSVIGKKNSEKGYNGYQTDSRMIRNALGHFDYLMDWKKNGFMVTFYNPKYSMESMEFDHNQFMKFIENHKFLMQSIMYIHVIMITFSTMREYFAVA